MRQLTIIIALTFGLISCNDNTKKPVDNKPLTEAQQIAKLDKFIHRLGFCCFNQSNYNSCFVALDFFQELQLYVIDGF